MVDKIRALSSIPKRIFFKVPKNSISIYTGNRRENLRLLKEQFGLEEVRLRGEESCSQLELVVWYKDDYLLIKKGFTLAIITSFKEKNKLTHKALIKSYSKGKGAKWILFNRLNNLNKFRLINLNKNIKLTGLGHFLSIALIFLRKILSIKDFG